MPTDLITCNPEQLPLRNGFRLGATKPRRGQRRLLTDHGQLQLQYGLAIVVQLAAVSACLGGAAYVLIRLTL